MKKVSLNTKNIVRKNLTEHRERVIKESFVSLKKLKNKNQIIDESIKVIVKLVNEGYTNEEIKTHLDEVNPFEKLGNDVDWGKLGKESVWSGMKEYAIKWILRAFGIGENSSTTLAQLLADMDPLDLIRIFKDAGSCKKHAPDISDAVMETIVRSIGSKITKTDRNNYDWSGVGGVAIGNVVGAAITQSNLGEKIGDVFCNLIHK